MEKCVACQYYDRQPAKPSEAKSVQWGQCRKTAPKLHPVNAKSYMIEGVWPHVRDDDWCGEWKAATRCADTRAPDAVDPHPLVSGKTPVMPTPARAAVLGAVASQNGAFSFTHPGAELAAVGHGND